MEATIVRYDDVKNCVSISNDDTQTTSNGLSKRINLMLNNIATIDGGRKLKIGFKNIIKNSQYYIDEYRKMLKSPEVIEISSVYDKLVILTRAYSVCEAEQMYGSSQIIPRTAQQRAILSFLQQKPIQPITPNDIDKELSDFYCGIFGDKNETRTYQEFLDDLEDEIDEAFYNVVSKSIIQI